MTTFIAISQQASPFIVTSICRHEDADPYPQGMAWKEIDPNSPPEIGSVWDGAQWVTPALLLVAARNKLVTKLDNQEELLRALVLVLQDELNLHSTTETAILQAAASATNLADFKTRMGQISPIPQRTTSQLRTAVLNKLGM